MPYHTVASLKSITLAPSAYIDAIEALEPGWTLGRLGFLSSWLDDRLRKRYAVPFASPYPVTVTGWIEQLIRIEIYQKRGTDATDEQLQSARDAAQAAKDEIKEAADSVTGLFELPLRSDLADASGVTKPMPLAYSEHGPYNGTRNARALEALEPRN